MHIREEHSISEAEKINLQHQPSSKVDNLFSYLSWNKIFSNKDVVAVLSLKGIIGKLGVTKSGISLDSLNKSIEKAFSFNRLIAVCLVINSPGGSPAQSELIADRIIKLAKKKQVPVYSFVEDVAASGGYWLACAGDEIYALKNSIIGSIGVISSGFGLHKAITKLGIERRIYTSGNNKSVLDSFSPAKESDVNIIKNIQKCIHTHFIDYVKGRRVRKLKREDTFLFTGEFWAGEDALEHGLIDGIDNLYNFLDREFGDEVRVEHISAKTSWIKKKLGLETGIVSNIMNEILDSVDYRTLLDRYKNF